MPKRSGNIFEESMVNRNREQTRTEKAAVKGDAHRQKRTTLLLSILESDKLKLQRYALSRGETAASVIHAWIRDLIPEDV